MSLQGGALSLTSKDSTLSRSGNASANTFFAIKRLKLHKLPVMFINICSCKHVWMLKRDAVIYVCEMMARAQFVLTLSFFLFFF